VLGSFQTFVWPFVLKPLIICVAIMLFFQAQAIIFVWLERKVSGRIQDRLGPTRVGGKFGWLQTIADGVKLLLKEDLIPSEADQPLFRIAPYIVLVGSFAAFLALPFSDGWVAQNLNVAVYASGSKWALFGAMREAAQVVSYEVPMAICIVLPVMAAGTMNMTTAGRMQAGWLINFRTGAGWLCFHDPFTFFAAMVYLVCATASVKRAPFDLAEAESELVAGFHTEYSGFRWLIFFMAEYASMLAVSGIAITMFWGAWNGPIPLCDLVGVPPGHWFRGLLGFLNFIVKGYFLVLVMMWVRWTLPRIRIDQVMKTCLKYLLPMSCFLLLGAAVWPVLVPTRFGGLIGGVAAALVALAIVAYGVATTPASAAQGRRQRVY
jgi:NADH-quinone oxidoreductase subunit H